MVPTYYYIVHRAHIIVFRNNQHEVKLIRYIQKATEKIRRCNEIKRKKSSKVEFYILCI